MISLTRARVLQLYYTMESANKINKYGVRNVSLNISLSALKFSAA